MTESRLLLSCEHGGNRVPAAFAGIFAGQETVLKSHRGYDIGALAVARHLRDRLCVPLIAATTTRLLVDLNRSPGHPRQFSELTRHLDPEIREQIIARHYQPYRDGVERRVMAWIEDGFRVFHVSVHSFVAEHNGRNRSCDIGLLYDPSRPLEVVFCRDWQERLCTLAPDIRVRRNYPYRGVSDGLVTYLRRRFAPSRYAGIELEVNQARAHGKAAGRQRLIKLLAETLPHRTTTH